VWGGGSGGVAAVAARRPQAEPSTLPRHPGLLVGGMVSAAGVCAPMERALALATDCGSLCGGQLQQEENPKARSELGGCLRLAAKPRRNLLRRCWQQTPRRPLVVKEAILPASFGRRELLGSRLLAWTVEAGRQAACGSPSSAGRWQRPGRSAATSRRCRSAGPWEAREEME